MKMTVLTLVTLAVIGAWALLPVSPARAAAPAAAGGVTGSWEGKLVAGQASLRIWLDVTRDASGKLGARLISLDQSPTPIPCANVTLTGATFSFEVPAVKGSYSGRLSTDGKTIAGTWTQGGSLPLTFERQPQGARPPLASSPTPRPARPPVPLGQLGGVLDREFAPVTGTHVLEPSAGVGVVVGVLQNGQRRIFAYGAVSKDSIFEIGSVTKSFTGLLLAQLVAQRRVALDEPVRALLPPGTVAKPSGPEITLDDLASQRSGLPRLPANLDVSADPSNPYAAYGPAKLYAYLAQHGLALPQKASYLYSNLGYGLLGFVLARRAGETYGQLVESEIAGPLHLSDTAVHLATGQTARLAQGHDAANAAVPAWTFDALAGAGALRSTAGDLLTFLGAELHPASVGAGTQQGPAATLSGAIAMTQQLRAPGPPGMKVGMGWLYQEKSGLYWHNGGTGGSTSFVAFQPAHDRAVVVLYNREDIGSSATMFVQRVAGNVLALLAGTPAVPLQ